MRFAVSAVNYHFLSLQTEYWLIKFRKIVFDNLSHRHGHHPTYSLHLLNGRCKVAFKDRIKDNVQFGKVEELFQ